MANSTTSTNFYGYLEAVAGKGPCRDTEIVYKKAKVIYKKMIGLCRPLARERLQEITGERHILLSDDHRAVGCAPGLLKKHTMDELRKELVGHLHRLVEADRASGVRVNDCHIKLKLLVDKLSIVLKQQRQQVKVDEAFVSVQEAFREVLQPSNLDGLKVTVEGQELDVGARRFLEILTPFEKATTEAMNLADQSRGKAVLLAPMDGGWGEAIKAAKDAGILQVNFPGMTDSPLCKVAAMEIKVVVSTKREGILRQPVKTGELRLLTAVEYSAMLQRTTGEDLEAIGGRMKVTPVYASERDVIPAEWVTFPPSLGSTSALLQVELLEVDPTKMDKLGDCLQDLASKWKWFASELAGYLLICQRYQGQPLIWHENEDYEGIMAFARAYLQSLSENLEDQIKGTGGRPMELLGEMIEIASLNEEDFLKRYKDEDMEEDEDEGHDYLELDAEALRPPPLNQEYLQNQARVGQVGATATAPPLPGIQGLGVPSLPVPVQQGDSLQQGGLRQDALPRGGLQQGGLRQDALPRGGSQRGGPEALERRVQSRHSSGSASDHGEQDVAASATTASQLRGDDPTHTIALQMQRSRQVLQTMIADPDSTKYKTQRAKVEKMLELAERHFRDTTLVSGYDEFLHEEMNTCEQACAAKDDEFDIAEQKKKQKKEEKKDLMATLPKGAGRKFNGTPADWPYFRDQFVRIADSIDPSLAVDQMIGLVDCKKLRKRMKIYRDGFEILKHFDQDFGFSFVNCQSILNTINGYRKATNQSEEMDLIVQYRQAKRALDKNEDNGALLNVGVLLSWADKLLPTTTQDLTKILQDHDFGRLRNGASHIAPFFEHLEKVYERNSVMTRNRESLALAGGTPGDGKSGKKVGFETSLRAYDSVDSSDGGKGGCSSLCTTGPQHRAYNCPLLKDGKVGIKQIRKAKLCTCCVSAANDCKKGQIKRKDGTVVQIACPECKHSKRINCHQKCKKPGGRAKTDSSVPSQLDTPPVELADGSNVAATLTELRTESYCLANPNKIGSALEFVDHCMLQAPDGSKIIVRTIFDGGGTDTILDWRLNRFFHHDVPCKVGVNGAIGTKKYDSHIGDLKVIRSDGSYFHLKAIKGDLSSKAFTVKRKFIDIPPPLQHHFGNNVQSYNEVGDIRYYNAAEDFQVELVIGLDAVALSPMELGRCFDEFGQIAVWKSAISNNLLVTGSRKTGSAAAGRGEANQRCYVIAEEGNQQVNLLRTAVDAGDSRDLFAKRSNMTKIERKLFAHIEDSDEIVPPQPELCHSCNNCEVCADPFKARREQTVINLLDQLVTFQEGSREEGGGYHVRLLFDPEILAQVPEGREAALRRLLATERQLSRPGMSQAREYFNQKVQQCRDKGYLVKPEDFPDVSHLQKAYQPYSFALKDEEKLDGQEIGAPAHKTKARPVVDCSAAAMPGGASVNKAQYKIPDVHTLKISQILLQLRTAKKFCVGDISEYYYRLWCDQLTSSLTRVLFREGGLGSGGEIIELISPVSAMGLKQISTMSAHVRYRISLTIASTDKEGAKQLKGAYCDDVSLFEKYGECRKSDQSKHKCEDGEVLVQRATVVEQALNHAHLHLGQKWITDVAQEKCTEKMMGVRAPKSQTDKSQTDSEEKTVMLGNANNTSALGYRLHLGPLQPPGGSIRWRVHRPQSLNLEPKLRGARPDWAQLASSSDIRSYLREHGASKSSLLSLCSNLFDPLLLAASFVSSARQLFRQVLREVKLTSWKDMVPERYHERIAQLAEDLLEVAKKLEIPRLAVVPNPVKDEEHQYPYGFATLLLVSDGSSEAGIAAAYVHQQFPYESGLWAADADFSQVKVSCRLLCAALKLTDNVGHNSQVDGELLAKFLACQAKDFVLQNSLIKFHRVRLCSDSLTVEKAIRKTDACYSTWAGRRIASIQRSIDLDDSWHVPHSVTDATVDSCTKYKRHPSKAMDECWFYGKGVLDHPMQLLPFTSRSTYAQPRLDDLPSQWLSSAARTFLGLKLPTVVIMKLAVEEEPPVLTLLEQLANKYQNVDKAISVLQCLLKMKSAFRQLSVPAQREACRMKFIGSDYGKVSQQLGKRSTKLTQQLLLENDKDNRVYTLKGRFGYRATLLPAPKSSHFSKLVLQDAHNRHHLTNSARIMAKVGRQYAFTGGALKYLDKLRAECHMCRLLKPEAVKLLMGDPPPFMRGILPNATTTWQHQSTDIFGPWMMAAFPGARNTRGGQKRIKTWGLIVFDYATRAVDATLIEDYSASSVILGLKTIWSRVGRPQWLGFDAASNIASAEEIVANEKDLQMPSLVEAELLQKELQDKLGGAIEVRPRVPYAPFRQVAERGVQFCKRELRRMLQQTVGTLLTPLQACSILSSAVAHINERPLVLHLAPDDSGVLTPWFLSARNMSTFHSQHVELEGDLEHPLSRRAFQAQQRLDLFKGLFNVFYYKEMVKFGRWNTQNKQPEVGDVCLILDKIKGKAHFLQRFQLGRIREFTSPHVCEVDFIKQSPEVTAALIRDLKSHNPDDWRKSYTVKTSSCTRDLRSLALVSAQSQEKTLQRGLDVDLFVDQLGPEVPDLAVPGAAADATSTATAPATANATGPEVPNNETPGAAVLGALPVQQLVQRPVQQPGVVVEPGVVGTPKVQEAVLQPDVALIGGQSQQQDLVPVNSSRPVKRKALKERWVLKQ